MPAPARIFDQDHLKAQTGGDLVLQDELLVLFVRQSAEIFALLQEDATLPRIRADLAHKLTGSARAVGAFRLADAAETVEAGFREGRATPAALSGLKSAIEAARVEIGQYLSLIRATIELAAATQHKS